MEASHKLTNFAKESVFFDNDDNDDNDENFVWELTKLFATRGAIDGKLT